LHACRSTLEDPLYRLEDAYRENDLFQHSPTLTLAESLKTLRWRLWDEDLGRMVGFARVAELRKREKLQKQQQLAQA
jgi:hypothetical protein